MPKRAAGLTAGKVEKAAPGRYGDGGGLYLLVRSAEAAFFIFRYTRAGKMREMGLGPARGKNAVKLVDARSRARSYYDAVRAGRDPLAEQEAEKIAAKANAQRIEIRRKTFRDVGALYIAAHEGTWKNPKHRQQWGNTLEAYVYKKIGDLPVADIDTGDVMNILEPIWSTIPETASRLRGRIEVILDYAKARGWRAGENPARWRGHLTNLLPSRSKVRNVEHHPALPYGRIAEFIAELRKQDSTAARALEFLVLNVGRTSEVTGFKWSELDRAAKLWTVPGERMKGKREHRVPLSARSLEILSEQEALKTSDYVFPGARPKRPLSNMAFEMIIRRMNKDTDPLRWTDDRGSAIVPHGFRSTFKDWAAERTNFANEISEAALAHAIGDKTEAAYRRGDLFEKRRRLMEAWARYCDALPAKDNVTQLASRATA